GAGLGEGEEAGIATAGAGIKDIAARPIEFPVDVDLIGEQVGEDALTGVGVEGVDVQRPWRFDVACAGAGNAVADGVADGDGEVVGCRDIPELEGIFAGDVAVIAADGELVDAAFGHGEGAGRATGQTILEDDRAAGAVQLPSDIDAVAQNIKEDALTG